jgi:hypothetical protein
MRHLVSTTASLALLFGLGAAASAVPTVGVAQASIGVSVGFGPPALPIYDQPPIPGYGFIWTPGFWAWDNGFGDYYWVPGAWVQPPRVGLLWTPGYWGWNNGAFIFNQGYWAPHIGFYGGINYGFGYTGDGYEGGYWRGNQLFYNRAVDNLGGARISTLYSKPVAARRGVNASFAGGPGGVQARPTSAQLLARHDQHITATAMQTRQVSVARTITANRASVNHGKPAIAATPTVGVVNGPGVIPAKAAAVYHRPANAPPAKTAPLGPPPAHVSSAAAANHPPAPAHAAPPPSSPEGHAPPPSHAPPPHAPPPHAPPPAHRPPEHAAPPPMSSHGPPMGPGGGAPFGGGHGPGGPGPGPSRAPAPSGNADKHEPPHP